MAFVRHRPPRPLKVASRPPDYPFDKGVMTRGAMLIDKAVRKCGNKSNWNQLAARVRLHSYAVRDPALACELARRSIFQAAFSVALTGEYPAPGAIPATMDPHPFTLDQFQTMLAVVQEAADVALSEAFGHVDAARVRMWRTTMTNPELLDALAGLSILAMR